MDAQGVQLQPTSGKTLTSALKLRVSKPERLAMRTSRLAVSVRFWPVLGSTKVKDFRNWRMLSPNGSLLMKKKPPALELPEAPPAGRPTVTPDCGDPAPSVTEPETAPPS